MLRIRPAAHKDLPAIGAIYNHVVKNTFAIYQDNSIVRSDLKIWVEGRKRSGYPFLVAEIGGKVVGYASFGAFRGNPGYRSTVENAVHVSARVRGRGIGTRLMEELLRLAQEGGYHAMVAAIDSENEGSLRLHRRFGFSEVGRLPEIARKRGHWRTLVLMQKILGC